MEVNKARAAIRAIEWDCHRLLQHLYVANDRGDFDAAAQLFADDGEWTRGGKTERGPEAISAWSKGNPPRVVQHFICNIVIDVDPGLEQATATAYFLALLRPNTTLAETPVLLERIQSTGLTSAAFKKTPEGWRISRMSSRPLFVS